MTARSSPALSVVVPTLDEARRLPRLLDELRRLGDGVEVVVADGGSGDGTRALARDGGARVVRSQANRGLQLRTGAEAARAPWLLFLHADSRLTPPAARAARAFVERGDEEVAAYFPFALEGDETWFRVLERGQPLRERVAGLVYGDQGLVVSRALYERVGGHPPWPLMEDVAVVDRLRRTGHLIRLEAPLPTSPRRYRREGYIRGWLRNALLVSLFRLGVAPERLLAWYAPEPAPADHETLLVFAKAPRPGTVKTRLAADLGHREATRIYRSLGSGVVEAVRGGPWHTVVAFSPTDARAEMVDWLGDEQLIYRPQSEGDLGRRMEEAFRQALQEGAARVCVVGTDAPGVDAAVVSRAFEALADHDVVLGPARDGGYYLLAARTLHPELFRDIPWSTDRVLARTRDRIRTLGLRAHLLPELRDVDRVADVPPGLLRA